MAEQDWNRPPSDPAKTEEHDYEEAARSTADYDTYAPPEKPRHKWLGRLAKLLLILIVAGSLAAAGIYWFVLRTEPPAGVKPAQETSQTSPAAPTTKITSATKRYDSPNFYLGFDYPQDWTVTDSGGGQMTVRSPPVDLKSAAGQAVKGQITLTFRTKDQKLPEFDSGNATAARPSEKINYTKPSPTQRGSTYLSFLRYSNSTINNGLDGIYITGDTGYQTGQAVPKADFTPVDPIVSITFAKCSSSSCEGQKPSLTIPAASWDDGALSKPIKSMLQSLSIT